MAATITSVLYNPNKFTITRTVQKVVGTGAPANGDTLCTQTTLYPIGVEYLDTANSKIWHRIAAAGVAADFRGVAIA